MHGCILVPRGRASFGQHQESRPLAGADFLSMRFVFSADQSCKIWRKVRETRTSGVGADQKERCLCERECASVPLHG